MISPELLAILRCPETSQPLQEAPRDVLDRVNEAIDARRARNRGGDTLEERLDEGLVREDGKLLYPVREEIPIMLMDEAISLEAI